MSCTFCCRSLTSAKKLGITFHSFPKDDIIKNAWIEACVSRGCELGENINSKKLCSTHFTSNDYEEDPSKVRRILKKEVVPSCFSRKPFVYCIACSDVGSEYSDVYLHRFPEDGRLRKKWIDACRQNNCIIKNICWQHALCSKHFSPSCFIVNDKRRKYLKLDAVPLLFTLSTTASGQQCEDPITDSNLIGSTSGASGTAASCSVEPCDDNMSPNADTTTKCIENSTVLITNGAKRRLPNTDGLVSRSPQETNKKIKIWRPARAGDLREEHFSTPSEAKKHFHLLSSKCKHYQKIIAQYRTKTWRLQNKIRTLETLFSRLSDKIITEESAVDISDARYYNEAEESEHYEVVEL